MVIKKINYDSTSMPKTTIIVLGLLLIGLFGAGSYILVKQISSSPPHLANQPDITPTSIPTPTTFAPSSVPSLQVGGNSYLDPQKSYVFLYPNGYSLDMQNTTQFTRIYKIGPTQQGQTELYDGVNMTFETIPTNKQSLERVVDEKIKSATADGTVEITQPKKAITIKEYSGFTYTARGLGEATYIVLQKDQSSPQALSITYLAADPNNKGYQKEVDGILKTIQILK